MMKPKFFIALSAGLFFLGISSITELRGLNAHPLKNNAIVTPVKKTTWIDMQFKLLMVEKQGKTWSWSCIVKNNGPLLQSKRVQVTAFQLMGGKAVAEAGAGFQYPDPVKPGQIMNFGKQGWKHFPPATHIRVKVKDLQSGRFIAKTAEIPDRQ